MNENNINKNIKIHLAVPSSTIEQYIVVYSNFINNNHPDDSTFVQHVLPNPLKSFHLAQDIDHAMVFVVHYSERRYVHGIVFEVFQIERLEVLK